MPRGWWYDGYSLFMCVGAGETSAKDSREGFAVVGVGPVTSYVFAYVFRVVGDAVDRLVAASRAVVDFPKVIDNDAVCSVSFGRRFIAGATGYGNDGDNVDVVTISEVLDNDPAGETVEQPEKSARG